MPDLALSPGPSAAITGDDGLPGTLRVHIVGMWSTHARDIKRGFNNNWLVGVSWRGIYAGTFVNSFGRRSFTAGIERMVARGNDSTGIIPSFAYRLSVVSGYDERFMTLASRTPVLPLAQLVGAVESGPMGVEAGWAGLVATVGPSLRF